MGSKKRLPRRGKGSTLGQRLREARLARKLTQQEAGDKTDLANMSISRYERDVVEPGIDALNRLATIYKVSVDSLIRGTNFRTPQFAGEIPVHGWVAAGTPREAYEQDMGSITVPDFFRLESPKCFALTVSGESLAGDGIHDGDFLIVDPDASVKQGAIFIVRIGEEFVARHLHIENGHVRLRASNKKYEDLKASGVQLIGRVIGHIRKM
jgi:SOS-response transcriptional repressor LexA